MIKPIQNRHTLYTHKHKEVMHAWREKESEEIHWQHFMLIEAYGCMKSPFKHTSPCNCISPAVMRMDGIVIEIMQSIINVVIKFSLWVNCNLSPILFPRSTTCASPLYYFAVYLQVPNSLQRLLLTSCQWHYHNREKNSNFFFLVGGFEVGF